MEAVNTRKQSYKAKTNKQTLKTHLIQPRRAATGTPPTKPKRGPHSRQLSLEQIGQLERPPRRPRGRDLRQRSKPEKRSTERKSQDQGRSPHRQDQGRSPHRQDRGRSPRSPHRQPSVKKVISWPLTILSIRCFAPPCLQPMVTNH